MNASKRNLALLAMGLASSLALGQNADKNGAGPTRNDYRLRVVEPAEGAIIAGTRVQVTVNLEIPGQPADERKDGNTMPQPNVVVFLDDERRGDLKDLDNVLTLDDVKPGKHRITLLAMNKAGEVIDRRVIGIESTPANGSAVAPVAQQAMPTPSVATPRTEPAVQSPEPIPAPASHSFPKTGTSYPLVAGAGLVLVMTGLVVRRRA